MHTTFGSMANGPRFGLKMPLERYQPMEGGHPVPPDFVVSGDSFKGAEVVVNRSSNQEDEARGGYLHYQAKFSPEIPETWKPEIVLKQIKELLDATFSKGHELPDGQGSFSSFINVTVPAAAVAELEDRNLVETLPLQEGDDPFLKTVSIKVDPTSRKLKGADLGSTRTINILRILLYNAMSLEKPPEGQVDRRIVHLNMAIPAVVTYENTGLTALTASAVLGNPEEDGETDEQAAVTKKVRRYYALA